MRAQVERFPVAIDAARRYDERDVSGLRQRGAGLSPWVALLLALTAGAALGLLLPFPL